jgi:hypothetical protein
MTSTIWDTLADPPAIARESTTVHTPDPEDPEGEGTTETVYGPPLAKQSAGRWNRPWELELRLAPHLHAPCFTEGWAILRDETTPPSIPGGQKRGPDREQPVVDIEAGTATWWLLVDMTEQEINGVSEQKKAQLKQSVNQERDRRWPGTVNCDLAGDGSLVIPADARNDTDLRNIQAVTTTAQVVAGTPDAVLKFRDANDVTHNLSPEEVIALGLIVQAHVQSFYEKAWALKDSIDSMTSVELDAIDVRNNSHWGITNVSSSADSI